MAWATDASERCRPPLIQQQDLVLVGGGHSHALALRMLAMRPISGLAYHAGFAGQSHTLLRDVARADCRPLQF